MKEHEIRFSTYSWTSNSLQPPWGFVRCCLSINDLREFNTYFQKTFGCNNDALPFCFCYKWCCAGAFCSLQTPSQQGDVAASFIFLHRLYRLLSHLEEAAVTAQFSQCLCGCRRKTPCTGRRGSRTRYRQQSQYEPIICNSHIARTCLPQFHQRGKVAARVRHSFVLGFFGVFFFFYWKDLPSFQ